MQNIQFGRFEAISLITLNFLHTEIKNHQNFSSYHKFFCIVLVYGIEQIAQNQFSAKNLFKNMYSEKEWDDKFVTVDSNWIEFFELVISCELKNSAHLEVTHNVFFFISNKLSFISYITFRVVNMALVMLDRQI